MNDESKAVFLSYASQDTEAAKRICDALRQAGVEVWFDQSELVGGDAWDAKIRGQIGSCALFMPVVSASTQARREGYFRIEWRLAAQRTHAMADGTAFLMPVVIDATRDADALVPAEFKEVQWTKLPGGETTAAFVARVKKLLSGAEMEAGRPRPAERGEGTTPPKNGPSKWWWVLPIFGVTMALFLLLKEGRREPPPAPPVASAPAKPAPAAVSEARQLAEKAAAMSYRKYDSTADDFAAGEGLLKKALALDENDAEIWAISSRFNNNIRTRGFDQSRSRREQAKRDAERALKLDPDSLNGLFALARTQREADPVAAEATFRKVLARDPNHAEAMANIAYLCDFSGRFDEAAALYERAQALDPAGAALNSYLQFLLYFHYSRFELADRAIRASIAATPSANSVAGRAMLLLTWKGDAEEAGRIVEAAPEVLRHETRLVWVGATTHLARRQPADVLAVLARTESDFLQDNWYAGPKGWFTGLAHDLAGRPEAARTAWQAALAIVDERLAKTPDTGGLHLARGQLLARLGQTAEARREARVLEEMRGAQDQTPLWVQSPALIYAALGDADAALPLLQRMLNVTGKENAGWPLTRALLRLDPRWDKLRGDPRFQQLCEDPPAPVATREWPRNPELKRAMDLTEGLEAIPDDLALAEQIVKPVVERAPTDVEAVTVMARIQTHYMRRGFDRSDERSAQAKLYAERALQLGPDEPEALYAVATYLYSRMIDAPRTERLLRRAMELDPTNPRLGRLLADLLSATNRPAEAIAQGQDNVRRFPRDVLSHYDLARNYKDQGRYEEFDRELDATLAIAPLPNAVVWKARLQFGLHNDLPGMKTWLDRVPERVRGTERAVFSYFLYAGFGGDPESGLEALRGFPQKWFTDFEYAGPTALLNASLLELQGKAELARQQYEVALGEIQKMRATDPGRIGLNNVEFWTLLGLGRRDEARASYRRMIEGLRRPFTQYLVNGWWFNAIPGSLLLGERATALTLLRESLQNVPESRAAFRLRFEIDPRMAPFRADPEIKALLAEPEARK